MKSYNTDKGWKSGQPAVVLPGMAIVSDNMIMNMLFVIFTW